MSTETTQPSKQLSQQPLLLLKNIKKPQQLRALRHRRSTNRQKKNTAPITKNFAVTRDEAKAITLKHAGLNEAELDRYNIELDTERNTTVYEIEFNTGKYEYEYEVSAESGKILKNKKEFRD